MTATAFDIDVQTDAGQLDFNEALDDIDMTITTEGIPSDPYWRLRDVDSQLVMESSPDGDTWTEVGRIDANISLDAVRLAFGIWNVTAGAAVTFSELNTAPLSP